MSVATPGSSRRNPFDGDAPLTINAEFDISENHFPKEGVAGFSGSFGLSNAEELDLAINDCTEQIKKCPETERDRKKTLVKRLIELRIALNDLKAASRAINTVFKCDPDYTREGGSIPVTNTFQNVTGKSVLLLPMGAADDMAHAQNEKLDRYNYIEGTKLMAAYLYEIGKL